MLHFLSLLFHQIDCTYFSTFQAKFSFYSHPDASKWTALNNNQINKDEFVTKFKVTLTRTVPPMT